MASVTFDKKQLPQVAVLGVITLGVFGFFASKMFVAPATDASPAPPAVGTSAPGATLAGAPGAAGAPGTPGAALANATPDPSTLIGAGAPSDSMRDPFIPAEPLAALAPPTPPAPIAPAVAGAQGGDVPGLGQIKPLPLPGGGLPSLGNAGQPQQGQAGDPQDVPSWQVMGIIQSDSDPSNAVAILRDADSRRYLRLGDQLDPSTKLVGIDRNSITLIRSGQRLQLNVSSLVPELGGQPVVAGTVPSTPAAAPLSSTPVAPVPTTATAAPPTFIPAFLQSHQTPTPAPAPKPQVHQHTSSPVSTPSGKYVHGAAD